MPDSPATTRPAKRRRHGYRGYGSPLRHEHSGAVHWGTGFGGVGFARDGAILPPHPDLLHEELRERLPRRGED
jgi:hypothetical protein